MNLTGTNGIFECWKAQGESVREHKEAERILPARL
jgi:hypothetical protein